MKAPYVVIGSQVLMAVGRMLEDVVAPSRYLEKPRVSI